MNFSELCAAVYVETNRPDMVAQTQSAVLASTLKLHAKDFFFKDIQLKLVVLESPGYIHSLELSLFTRYRALATIRKWDASAAAGQLNPSLGNVQNLPMFDILTPFQIFDDYGVERADCCYVAGTGVNLKSSTSLSQVLFAYYAHPELGTASDNYSRYNSWIADEYPYAIIYDATSAILQKQGQLDAARKYDNPTNGLVIEHLKNLIRSNILAGGY